MRPTLRQIAEETGLSVAAVSQILNHRPINFCSAETKKQVLTAAERLGYRQQFADKVRRGESTSTAALIRRSSTTEEQIYLTMMLQEKFESIGFSTYVISLPPGGSNLSERVRELLQRGVDRFVLMGSPSTPEQVRQAEEIIADAGRSCIGYQTECRRCIMQDFAPAVKATLDFFSARIGDNFRMLLSPASQSNRQDALCAYFPGLTQQEVLDRYWFPLKMKFSISQDFDLLVRHGYERTGALMKKYPRTRGFYYLSDQLALGGVRWFVEHGLEPGKDVLLAGFNDYPGTRYCGYPVSTAAHDLEKLSDLLVEHSGGNEPCRIFVPPLIRLREKNPQLK